MLTSAQKRKRDRKREFWLLLFLLGLKLADDEVRHHAQGLALGNIGPGSFGAAMLTTLQSAHVKAAVAGSGGAVTHAQAQAYVQPVMKQQSTFLNGFVQAIRDEDPRLLASQEPPASQKLPVGEDERRTLNFPNPPDAFQFLSDEPEEGVWDEKKIYNRARMYCERIRGTANWSAVNALGIDVPIAWKLDPEETNHCEDCPRLAMNGPYTRLTLPSVPGDGATKCKVFCRCELQFLDENGVWSPLDFGGL